MTRAFTCEIAVHGELRTLPGFEHDKEYDEVLHGLTGLLMDVCAALEESGQVEFVVAGLGPPCWNADVEVDLEIIIEDLPVLRWKANRDEPFRLAFPEDSTALEFEPDADDYVVTFAEFGGEPPGHWTRDPNTIRVPKDEVRAMLTRLAEDFCRVAEAMCPGATRHPWYQQWRKELMQEARPRDLDWESPAGADS